MNVYTFRKYFVLFLVIVFCLQATSWAKPVLSQDVNSSDLSVDPEEAQEFQGALSDLTNGRTGKALEVYNRVIERRPRNGLAYMSRGGIKLLLRDFDGALADLEKASDIFRVTNRIKLLMQIEKQLEIIRQLKRNSSNLT